VDGNASLSPAGARPLFAGPGRVFDPSRQRVDFKVDEFLLERSEFWLRGRVGQNTVETDRAVFGSPSDFKGLQERRFQFGDGEDVTIIKARNFDEVGDIFFGYRAQD
jgi:hypothetical protein